jgi:thiol:disulfide interchange protein DsbA
MLKHSWLLVVLALAGCGGGSEPPSQAAAPPSAVDQPAQASNVPETEAPEAAAATQESAAAAALSTSTDSPTSARFRLGTHYERLSPTQPTSSGPDQVEVAEVFWYGCPHCFTFDPYLASWKNRKADYVNFVRIPAVWNPLVQLHARAFYTAEALGKGEEMHEALFREIHDNRNFLDTEEKLQAFFGKFNVSAADFKNAFDSFAVHTKIQRADELNRRYRVASVPMIVINGKYVTDVGMAGGHAEILDLIDELAASERAGK